MSAMLTPEQMAVFFKKEKVTTYCKLTICGTFECTLCKVKLGS